jgi:diacylglycerol O-acyltransferase / wax synthase
MSKPVVNNSLSATDAAFLYLERKEVPLAIASVCVFDGPIPFETFVASIHSRLHLVPRYQQVPVIPFLDLELPKWEADRNFDIRRHVIHATLDAPGGEAELQALAGRILSQPLDRSRPLWDVHVVDGLQGGRGAIIWRVHHALADGVSGLELMKIMMDVTPEVPANLPKPRRTRVRAPAAQQAANGGISGAVNTMVGSLLAFEAALLDFAETFLHSKNQDTLRGVPELLSEFASSIERLPFNKPCTGERKFCWAEFDIADVQAIRQGAGGTVNDVILAVLTRALARYVKLHGQSVVNRFVRIVCPVNLRHANENEGLGNLISFLPVALPMDAHGPVRMLQAVTRRTEALKKTGAARLVGLAAKWLAATPPPLQALFWRNIPEVILPVPLLNIICTNVVGPPIPLYAVGRRMLACYPQVPTGWDLGVGCAVSSYDGKLFFGLIADTNAAPDVQQLQDFLVESFHELQRSAAKRKARSSEAAKRGAAERPAETRQPLAAAEAKIEEPALVGAVPVILSASDEDARRISTQKSR